MTQRELARQLGVGERTVSAWERGENVPRNRLGAIRDLFGLNPADTPLAAYSEVALLSELLRRAAARSGQVANG